MKRIWVWGITVITVVALAFVAPALAVTNKSDQIRTNLLAGDPFSGIEIKGSSIQTPDWYKKQLAATPIIPIGGKTLTYTISSNGSVNGNMSEFASFANATLNDPRGWSRLGVTFKQVSSGGSFNLILSNPSLMPGPGCSPEYSCRVGNSVIINDTPWMNATPSWNAAGGSLTDYRHMVINHETGHWLGHGHPTCGGAGQLAPVMQQQSMGLNGCKFNPWPLPSELTSNRL